MSHFTVLVVTDSKPTEDDLEPIMTPFDENTEDERYMHEVDCTEEIEKEYPERGKGKHIVEFAQDYYGATERNGKFYVNKLKQAKWDFWSIGGRWTGMLAVDGYDPRTDPENYQTCTVCGGSGKRNDQLGREQRAKDPTYTCNGCDGKGKHLKHASEFTSHQFDGGDVGNHIRVGELRKHLPMLRDTAGDAASAVWDHVTKAINGHPIPDFDTLRDKHGVEKARELYWCDPAIKAIQSCGAMSWTGDGADVFRCTKEEYVKGARDGVICPFAFVHDGEWNESGRMGWFGCSSNNEEPEVWTARFAKMLDSLRDDQWLTVVDCHI